MAKVIKFRMEQELREHFVRDYEFLADTTLLDMNNFIRKELNHDPLDMTTLTLTDQEGTLIKEFSSLVESEPIGGKLGHSMSTMCIADIIQSADDRLVWSVQIMNFDNLDTDPIRCINYYLKPIDVMDAKGEFDYPRVAFAHGEALGCDEDDDFEDEKSIFEEMMDDFGDFGGSDDYDDEY